MKQGDYPDVIGGVLAAGLAAGLIVGVAIASIAIFLIRHLSIAWN